MSKYSNIRDLRDLDAAQAQVDEALRHKQEELSLGYRRVKEFYTPTRLVNKLYEAVSPVINVVGVVADIADRVVDKVRDLRVRRSERIANQESETPEKTPESQL